MLISHLQLSLSHPGNTGYPKEFARRVIGELTAFVTHQVPESSELIVRANQRMSK